MRLQPLLKCCSVHQVLRAVLTLACTRAAADEPSSASHVSAVIALSPTRFSSMMSFKLFCITRPCHRTRTGRTKLAASHVTQFMWSQAASKLQTSLLPAGSAPCVPHLERRDARVRMFVAVLHLLL